MSPLKRAQIIKRITNKIELYIRCEQLFKELEVTQSFLIPNRDAAPEIIAGIVAQAKIDNPDKEFTWDDDYKFGVGKGRRIWRFK